MKIPFPIDTSFVSQAFDLKLVGQNIPIYGFSIPDNQKENTIIWTKTNHVFLNLKKGIIIAPESFESIAIEGVTYLFCSKSPRLIFAKIINKYFSHLFPDDLTNFVHEHKNNKSIKIGENCFIAKNVKIGADTIILHNTSIFENTVIGNNCLIQSGCSLGTSGLGFEYDGEEIVNFPQLGGVVIKNNVEIGPNSTIRKGALGNTIIEDGCKIGALSNIGHNSHIGAQSILTCQCIIGGSAVLGKRVFMGMNSIIKNKIVIGNNTVIGMGAVVTKNFPSDITIIGIPAKIKK
ncbi:MAG: hypothetical protein A2275_12055 [Bacteroidetes bacterium RIFOXYA12_FULL_35_11]|nr:MAG: hypothetical protein A2X01_17345 [Bacteroidetes bacterium GWF2_35_48]OFY77649.1 MAG: hypothetical protein A2275_12055 [Bacteroidetes bacterium RIFOXYA12_FULL_35_11]OFY92515.1 MAG: hypothetical protein A2309_04130 [Bacteroidetes bacterium RIFOXYB2_FULL_35_7]HBX52996.1 hypothetical protein [Bacteroidales bacterium]